MKRFWKILDIKTLFGELLGLLFIVGIMGGGIIVASQISSPWNTFVLLASVLLIFLIFLFDYIKAKRLGREMFLLPNSYHVIRSPLFFLPAYLGVAYIFWSAVAPWAGILVIICGVFYVWWEHIR